MYCRLKNGQRKKTGSKISSTGKLASALLCLPHGTACVERIVADLNRIKTKDRNTLGVESLNSLLLSRDAFKRQRLGFQFPVREIVEHRMNPKNDNFVQYSHFKLIK